MLMNPVVSFILWTYYKLLFMLSNPSQSLTYAFELHWKLESVGLWAAADYTHCAYCQPCRVPAWSESVHRGGWQFAFCVVVFFFGLLLLLLLNVTLRLLFVMVLALKWITHWKLKSWKAADCLRFRPEGPQPSGGSCIACSALISPGLAPVSLQLPQLVLGFLVCCASVYDTPMHYIPSLSSLFLSLSHHLSPALGVSRGLVQSGIYSRHFDFNYDTNCH